jgi:outer membrane protein assembly factor BamE (lipoprotein component of BamABCDE complex)
VRVFHRFAAALAVATALIALPGCRDETHFDAAYWRSQRGVPENDNGRFGMVEAMRHHVHPGMTREAVLALLGPPDATEPAGDLYILGIGWGGIDGNYLYLDYENDVLAKIRVVQG